MVGRASQVTSRTTTPLIADADTGFGGPLNVQHTIRGYEKAGVQAIQIEDQEFPKKCGHTLGRRVVPIEDMVTKIEVAAEARESDDFLIIARTDSRTTLGLDEALRRGEAFAKAGADIVFIESPESLDEMKTICANFDKPCFANMVEGGRTPLLSAAELEDIGFKMAIFPGTGFLATAQVLSNVYGALKKDGISTDVSDQLYPFEDMNKLMGFEDVWEFDKKYGD
jgi:2-methylisocitrate lyase-like PEP mutase family enzyme